MPWASESMPHSTPLRLLHSDSAALLLLLLPAALDLRRLHLCAQASEKLLVVFRPVSAHQQSTPARLRLRQMSLRWPW